MRVLFMGTPEFSVPTLEALIASHHQVIGVVTQPDKPKGRGKEMQETPIKQVALAHGIPVYQPRKAREPEFLDLVRELNPDVAVVIAYGQILSKAFLEIPKYGCINVHASLLPKYRGAGPIQWSVINGETETGVTIMQMDPGIDTGDMLLKAICPIAEDETAGSLHDKLSVMGGPMIVKVLDDALEGKLMPIKQDHSASTHAPMLTKEMGNLDYSRSAKELKQLIQGLNPWPSAYTSYKGKMIKIWQAEVMDISDVTLPNDATPGMVIAINKHKGFAVLTGEGALMMTECQVQGKNRMTADAFMRGYPMTIGDRLGE